MRSNATDGISRGIPAKNMMDSLSYPSHWGAHSDTTSVSCSRFPWIVRLNQGSKRYHQLINQDMTQPGESIPNECIVGFFFRQRVQEKIDPLNQLLRTRWWVYSCMATSHSSCICQPPTLKATTISQDWSDSPICSCCKANAINLPFAHGFWTA